MSRYDGLIIPRSYSEYINKTDAATLSQALQLPGVVQDKPAKESKSPIESGGVWGAIHAISHNIPRVTPKDITAYITDGTFWKRLAGINGFALFEDIYVGDYFKMSRAISAYERTGQYQTTGSQYVTIAGLDTMMNKGDQGSGVNYHHAVMVAGQGFGGTQHFGKSQMNATNTTEGGYKASEMNTLVLGDVVSAGSTAADATINQQLYAEFGAHLKTTRELVTNTTARKARVVVVGIAKVVGKAETSRTRNVFQPPIRRMVILRLFAESEKGKLTIGVSCVISRTAPCNRTVCFNLAH